MRLKAGIAWMSVAAFAMLACNRGGEEKEGTAMPQEPATTGAAPQSEKPATAAGAMEGPAGNTTPPAVGGNPVTAPKNPADAGTSTDAGTSADAGDAPKADAGAADAGAGSTSNAEKLKACAQKCQSSMQACLTPDTPKPGELPKLKDPAACQAAAEACRAACSP